MAVQDKRHSILVARRFVDLADAPSREQTAAALLHDVGKLASGLGTCARVLATIVGPRTARFRQYHDHERLGAEMLRAAGSAAATLELVHGAGPAAAALRQADDI
jgi:predicted HD phosphohydrolase